MRKKASDFLPNLHIRISIEEQKVEGISLSWAKSFDVSLAKSFQTDGERAALLEWFIRYFQGDASQFPLPVNFTKLSKFTRKTLQELQRIPFGEVSTYSEVAEKLGNRKAARAIGNACNRNPFPLVVPCHRVIRKGGDFGGFALGSKMKKTLLELEQVASNPR